MSESGILRIDINTSNRKIGNFSMSIERESGQNQPVSKLPSSEPDHFIVPYFSKRKVNSYNEDVREQFAMQIGNNFTNLAAKLSRVSNPEFPNYETYRKTCKDILGFVVTAIPSEGGQRAGVYLPDKKTVPIDQMGEGVPNIVSLLAELAVSENKIFLIEEPENDLHPSALKALLDLIIISSTKNQFVISTHSNIVLRHLGAETGANVYNILAFPNELPTRAEAQLVPNTPQDRLRILSNLGYSFSDFDLWDGWLFLEEASAERIIRDYLIPWFAPKLSRIRTLAAGGADDIDPRFSDFERLTRFTHLENAYRGLAWVRVDGDEKGKAIVSKLQSDYKAWPPDRFANFSSDQFERYYPADFQDKIDVILKMPRGQHKTTAKKALLLEVLEWLNVDEKRGREALAQSAKEIIDDLASIQETIMQPRNGLA
ncbi:ATP-dependent nuclease [Asticcacaulis taihuensis]|uniref:ATP-dependent nuclease n=1 Tax=Asticcacaulis taihuensis TaxID=260084 RepID=UPI003F7B66BE